jgi:hypothetical protein
LLDIIVVVVIIIIIIITTTTIKLPARYKLQVSTSVILHYTEYSELSSWSKILLEEMKFE